MSVNDKLKTILERKSHFQVLKNNQVPLTDEERDIAMKAKATWNHGPNGEATCAVWKSVDEKTGKVTYITNTHRCSGFSKTLEGCINKYHRFIKGTA